MMCFCLQIDVCISGGGSLISGSLQYFVISDVWNVCFPDFIALGYL